MGGGGGECVGGGGWDVCEGATLEFADENCWKDDILSIAMSKLSLVVVAVVASIAGILQPRVDLLAALDPLPLSLEDWRWSNWLDSSPGKYFSDKVSGDFLPSCLVGVGELTSSPEDCDNDGL